MTDQSGAQRPGNRASGAGLADRHQPVPGPICGPYALHICTGVPLDLILAAMGQDKRSDWKGRTFNRDLLSVLTRLAVPYREIPGWFRKPVIQLCWPGRVNPHLPMLIEVSGHYITLYDGRLFDQSSATEPPEHRYREYTIKNAWQIMREPNHNVEESIL